MVRPDGVERDEENVRPGRGERKTAQKPHTSRAHEEQVPQTNPGHHLHGRYFTRKGYDRIAPILSRAQKRPIAAMASDAGTTTRARYQTLFLQAPTARRAARITV